MSRLFAKVALLAVTLGFLSACGSPFVKGWRDDQKEERTDQEKCEAIKDYQWIGGACQKKGTFQLDGVGEADCQKVGDAIWKNERCTYFKDLATAGDCSSVGWTWANDGQADRCMLPAEASCIGDTASAWVVDHCVTRPILTVQGNVTQALAVGNVFDPLTITISNGAQASLKNATCADFFFINADKLTSKPATSQTSCEADLVATTDGAESLVVHLTATIDKGFLAHCKQFEDQEAAMKDRLLARTIFAMQTVSGKATCEDAATALATVTDLEITGARLVDLKPFASLTQLRVLRLADNEITDLTAIAYLPHLQLLMLSGNSIKKVEATCPTNENVNFAVLDYCSDQ